MKYSWKNSDYQKNSAKQLFLLHRNEGNPTNLVFLILYIRPSLN